MKKAPPYLKPVENLPTNPLVLHPTHSNLSALHFHDEDSNIVRVTRALPAPANAFWKFQSFGKAIFHIRSHPNDRLFWTWHENRLIVRSYSGNTNQEWEIFHQSNRLFYIRCSSVPENKDFLSVNVNFIEDEPVTFAPLGSLITTGFSLGTVL